MPVVLVEKQTPQITLITLNRPERRNALPIELLTERTKIGYPEVRRGLVAGLIMTFLRRQLRERDLRELLLASELIDAKRAQEIGLVNRVVPPNELENAAQEIATAILQGAPSAIAN